MLNASKSSKKSRKVKGQNSSDNLESKPPGVKVNAPNSNSPDQKLKQKAEEIKKDSKIEEIEEKVTEEYSESQIFHF